MQKGYEVDSTIPGNPRKGGEVGIVMANYRPRNDICSSTTRNTFRAT